MTDGGVPTGRSGEPLEPIPMATALHHSVHFVAAGPGPDTSTTAELAALFAAACRASGRAAALTYRIGPERTLGVVRLGRGGPVLLAVVPEGGEKGPLPGRDRRGEPRYVLTAAGSPTEEIDDRSGDAFVLGVLAWMYRMPPDTVRRLLENRLAVRGRTVVGGALRRFERGWRTAPQWAPYRCPRPAEGEDGTGSPRAGSRSAIAMLGRRRDAPFEHGKLTATGGRALAQGALAAGLNRCSHSPFHPLVDEFADTYCRGGGEFDSHHADRAVARPARPVRREGRIPLRLEIAGMSVPQGPPGEPAVTLRIERIPERWQLPMFAASSSAGERFPRGDGAVFASSTVFLAPASVPECDALIRLGARIVREWGHSVTVLVDGALLAAKGWLAPSPEPEQTSRRGGDGLKETAPGRGPSPMNCQLFAPSVLAAGRGSTPGAEGMFPGRWKAGRRPWAPRVVPVEDVLPPPAFFGEEEGDLLLIGWGAGRDGMEQAVEGLRRQGWAVSGLHLTALHPAGEEFVQRLARFGRLVVLEPDGDPAAARRRLVDARRVVQQAVRPHVPFWQMGEWPPEHPPRSVELWTVPPEPDGMARAVAQRMARAAPPRKARAVS